MSNLKRLEPSWCDDFLTEKKDERTAYVSALPLYLSELDSRSCLCLCLYLYNSISRACELTNRTPSVISHKTELRFHEFNFKYLL